MRTKALDSAKLVVDSNENQFGQFLNPYSGRASVTLFNVLYSLDNINFQKYTVDTIDYNSMTSGSKSTVITKIKSMAFMNDYTYVRFLWIKRHPQFQFDPTNMTSRWDLYYYYLEFGSDKWKYDPLTNSLPGIIV